MEPTSQFYRYNFGVPQLNLQHELAENMVLT